MIKEALWVGRDGMDGIGMVIIGHGESKSTFSAVLIGLNIFCLLSSSAYAALQFDSGLVPVCMVRSSGLLPCSVLSP